LWLTILGVNDYHSRYGCHPTSPIGRRQPGGTPSRDACGRGHRRPPDRGDTGVALHLGEIDEPGGAHLENLILADLLAWRDARLDRAELYYWRTAIGEEVDFVVEAGKRLLPIEVKATTRPRLRDATHLRTFRGEYGKKARAGLLLHTGSSLEWLAPDVLAAPWWRVL
jgi:predicted AAA+ superfamily ATPase